MTAGRRSGAPSNSGRTTKSSSSSLKKGTKSASSPARKTKPKGGKGGIAKPKGAKVGGIAKPKGVKDSSSSPSRKGGKQTKPVAKGAVKDEGANAKGKRVKLQAKGKTDKGKRPPRDAVSKDSPKPKKKIRGKKRKVAVTLVGPDTEDEEPPPSKRRRETGGNDAALEGAAAESPVVLRPFYETVEAFLEANAGSWELLPDTTKEASKSDAPKDHAAAKQEKKRVNKKLKLDDTSSVRWLAKDGRQLCMLPARVDNINAFLGGKKYAKLKMDALKVQVKVKPEGDEAPEDAKGKKKGKKEPSAPQRGPRPPRPQVVKNLRGCCSKCSHLAQACASNHADCARAILEAARSRGADALKRVLGSSADANAGFLPMHAAAFAGQVPMLRLLVEGYGADINAAAWGNGLTPVMIAALGGLAESAAWMAEHGAKLSARTTGLYKGIRPGKCAMDLAKTIKKEERRNATVEALRLKATGGSSRKPTVLKGGDEKKTNEEEPDEATGISSLEESSEED